VKELAGVERSAHEALRLLHDTRVAHADGVCSDDFGRSLALRTSDADRVSRPAKVTTAAASAVARAIPGAATAKYAARVSAPTPFRGRK